MSTTPPSPPPPGYFRVAVARVIEETADARSFELAVPPGLEERFRYQAGQFLTFRVPYGDRILTRSYSLASAPGVDPAPKVTVKRVEGGRVSHWFNGRVKAGAELECTAPSGRFVLREASTPLGLFAGGSGITPIIALAKAALATTGRRVVLLYANRDAGAVIFRDELKRLAHAEPTRLRVVHHLDELAGWLLPSAATALLPELPGADHYLCGPAPFMDLVESALLAAGVPRGRVATERFVSPSDGGPDDAEAPPPAPGVAVPARFLCRWQGKDHVVPYRAGQSLLAAAREAGVDPPFSCEDGYCSSCQAKLLVGQVRHLKNDVLSEQDLAEGAILTCQAHPESAEISIDWDA